MDKWKNSRAGYGKQRHGLANRLMEVRHWVPPAERIAEISVPAWPIPIHQTKLMIAKPHCNRNLNAPDPHAHSEEVRDGIKEQHHQRERSGKPRIHHFGGRRIRTIG